MDCTEFNNLILPHLDGLLQDDQSVLLGKHAGECCSCASALTAQARLPNVLRDIGREEIQAPPELAGLVMSRLKPERRGYLSRIPLTWRQTAAAAAALLLLAGGSAGVTAGLKMAGGGNMAALDPLAAVIDDNNSPASGSGVVTAIEGLPDKNQDRDSDHSRHFRYIRHQASVLSY